MLLFLRRILARFFDYGVFYFFAVFVSLMLPLEIDDTVYLLFALTVPFFWAPIEVCLIKKWGTTPGKRLFGISLPELSWKAGVRRALFLGRRPGAITSEVISFWRYLIALMVACSAGSALFFGKNISDVAIQYEQGLARDHWVQYISDDGRFSVQFPQKPEVASKTYNVPNGEPLSLSECRVEQEADFTVSYLDLPKKWKIFSSTTLLKGAMNVVLDHMPGTQVVEKKIIKHKNYPAMDFRLKEGDNIIEGRLILVGNTLYRLMVVYYPDTPRDAQHQTFLGSFELKAPFK